MSHVCVWMKIRSLETRAGVATFGEVEVRRLKPDGALLLAPGGLTIGSLRLLGLVALPSARPEPPPTCAASGQKLRHS